MTTSQRTPFICDDRSGWYKGAPTALLHDLIESAQRAVLIALTEVTAADRQKALHKVPGFDVHQDTAHGDADEIALLAKGAVWKTLHYEAAILGPDLGPGGREIAGILVLEHAVTGARILVSKAHLPASVEGDFNGPRGRAHQACVQKWRARIKVLAARYDVDAQLVWADWNLDLHKPWVQAWIKKAWPELRLPDRIPAWSTHAGGRLIDWFLFTGLDIESWEQLPRSETSDHRGSRLAAAILAYKEKPVSKPEIYPGADAKTQWHADDHPGVHFDANCGCLHTTEGTDWPPYSGGATAPNITFKPDFKNKRLVGRQHFPIDMSSRALKNLTGGVETNTLNVVQVELVGTCDPKHRETWNGLHAGIDYIYWPDAPEWALRDLAKFMTWCSVQHGVPLEGMKTWVAYPKSAGFGAAQRMSASEWRAFKGWCGHQHVPENDHGDPGDLPFAHLLELARGAVPARPVEKTRGDDIDAAIASLRKATPSPANAPKVKAALESLLSITPKAK